MNKSTQQSGPGQRAWWTNKRIVCIALVLGAAAYVMLQPRLEQWTGLDLPDLMQNERDGDVGKDNAKPTTDEKDRFKIDPAGLGKKDGKSNNKSRSSGKAIDGSSNAFKLKEVGRDRFESPQGLVYTMGPRNEHRIDHVMRHAKNNSGRPVHGVFDADTRDEVLALLDEAYKLVKAKDRSVRAKPDDKGRVEYVIDFPKRVGYVGGFKGDQQNNPGTRRMELILHDDRVITAYPTWPPRR